jgi:hypothetical protein
MPWPWKRKLLQKPEERVWKNDRVVKLGSLSDQERTRVLAAREFNEKLQQRAGERRKENEEKKKKSPKF